MIERDGGKRTGAGRRGAADRIAAAIAAWSAGRPAGAPPLVVGLCGPPGAGKSSIAAAIAGHGVRLAVLSLDDLYLAPDARARLAATVHPLLRLRGVPGTHDVGLGVRTLAALAGGTRVALPRFDKGTDAPRLPAEWPVVDRVDVVLFEGWCVGARPQPASALTAPVNDRERDDDPDGVWRRFVNDQLAGPYRALFAPLDRLILLRAPDFAAVVGWRQAAERARAGAAAAMTDDGIVAFLATYERLSRWIEAEMPDRADLTLRLRPDRSVAD